MLLNTQTYIIFLKADQEEDFRGTLIMWSGTSIQRITRLLRKQAHWLQIHTTDIQLITNYFQTFPPSIPIALAASMAKLSLKGRIIIFVREGKWCSWMCMKTFYLSLTICFHQFVERCVPLDFELNHWAILPSYFQIYVVVLCFYTLLKWKGKYSYHKYIK